MDESTRTRTTTRHGGRFTVLRVSREHRTGRFFCYPTGTIITSGPALHAEPIEFDIALDAIRFDGRLFRLVDDQYLNYPRMVQVDPERSEP